MVENFLSMGNGEVGRYIRGRKSSCFGLFSFLMKFNFVLIFQLVLKINCLFLGINKFFFYKWVM